MPRPFAPLCFSNLQIRFQKLFWIHMEFFTTFPKKLVLIVFKRLPTKRYDQRLDRFQGGGPFPRIPSCWFPKVWFPQGSSIFGAPRCFTSPSYHILSPASSRVFKMCKETPWGNLGMKHLGVRSDVRNIDCAAWPRTWWKNSVRRVVWTVLVGFAAKKASHPLAVFFGHFFGVRRTLYFGWCPWYSI